MKIRGSIIEDMAFGALLALDSLCRFVPRPSGKRAVVVRVDAVGDHFLWLRTGAVDVSRYARAEAERVVLITSPAVAPYARESGLWDDVLELSELRFLLNPVYRLRVLRRIRSLGAALLIQPRASRALWLEDAIARVCGIPRKIGSTGTLLRASESQRKRGDGYYGQLIPIDGGPGVHESTRNVQFVQGLQGHLPTAFRFERPTGGVTGTRLLVALGAGARGRVWPIEKLARVVAYIANAHPGVRILVAGTKADVPAADRLQELAGVRFENRVGSTTLRQFVELVASSDLTICNESAAYHIARAYGRHVVCLLGGGHYGTFVPYPASFPGQESSGSCRDLTVQLSCFGCNWRCVHPRPQSGTYKCIDEITAESAIEAVNALLLESGER
jgi:ADP-heptose:LPS heptosyltransferase